MFVARELTKLHESLLLGSASQVLRQLRDGQALRGEFVVVVEGPAARGQGLEVDSEQLLLALAEELPPAQAARVAARLTGGNRADFYARLQELNG